MTIQKSVAIVCLVASLCSGVGIAEAERLQFTLRDAGSDPLDSTDLTELLFSFDNETGDFEIKVSAHESTPFHGGHWLYLYLVNPDASSMSPTISYLRLSRFFFEAEEPSTVLTRTGNAPVLTTWELGDRVASYDVFGVPPGLAPGFNSWMTGNNTSLFRNSEIRDIAMIVPEAPAAVVAVIGLVGAYGRSRQRRGSANASRPPRGDIQTLFRVVS